jgi:flagellar biosynthetic protein FliR
MNLEYMVNSFQKFFLVLARVSGIFSAATPFFGSMHVPMRVRAALALFISLAIFPAVLRALDGVIPDGLLPYACLVGQEVLIGITIGVLCQIVITAFPLSGQIYSFPMGLGVMQVFDPLAQIQVPVVSQVLALLALMIFLSFGGPQMILLAVTESFKLLPTLKLGVVDTLTKGVIDIFCNMFLVAFMMALPILGVMFLCELGIGLMARAAPQMNLLLMGWPAKILIGLFTLTVFMPIMYEQSIKIYTNLFNCIHKLFVAMGAGV